jgi:2-polyprenyl-6-methoxyphenol hydroxylase-like FAD-dependent oxidoreductase
MTRTAIVVGAGIGGLATSAGLSRQGWEVTVFEQASDLAPLGAGIALAPNGVRALDWLGVGSELRERGQAAGAAGLRTANGRWLLRTTVEAFTARYGVPAFVLHRADLHAMLLNAASGADIKLGHRVRSTSSVTSDAEVAFDVDGRTGSARADLVVAADGIWSALRGRLFPAHPGPSSAGYITWRGIAPAEAVTTPLPGLTESWGRGRRFGVAPLADGRVYWFATETTRPGALLDEPLDAVRARFARWHRPIPDLLAATPPDALLAHDIHHLATPLPSYSQGATALVGDAAHAVTPDLGQGACQALEDAVTLAAIAEDPDWRARYDDARLRRTQALVRESARAARIANARHVVAAWLRDTAAWLLPSTAYLRASAGTFDWVPPTSPRPAAGGRT